MTCRQPLRFPTLGAAFRAARMRSKLWLITFLLGLTAAGFALLSGLTLLDMRHDTWSRETRGARNLVAVEGDDIARTIAIYAATLRSTTDALENPELRHAAGALQRQALFDHNAAAPYLGAVRVLDAAGAVVADSTAPDPASARPPELDALRHHLQSQDPALYISHPLLTDGAGAANIFLSRGYRDANGNPGVVIGSIDLMYFSRIFGGLRLGPHDVVGLFRDDGTLLAHAPVDRRVIGRNISDSPAMRYFSAHRSGEFVARSALDGEKRVYSFVHIDGLPLILDLGLSVHDLYAPWRRKALLIVVALLTMGLSGSGLILALRAEVARRLEAEQAVLANEERYRLLADNVSDVIVRLDSRLERTYVSPSSMAYGYSPRDLMGSKPQHWAHPDDWPAVEKVVESARSSASNAEVVYRVRHRLGHYVWIEARFSYVPADGGFIVVIRDISARKAHEAKLEELHARLTLLASADSLTGLANRRHFDETLVNEWRRAIRGAADISLLVIDVDDFKSFNDLHGHQAGDTVLQAIASTAQAVIRRPGDLAARYGGEEFVVILPSTDLLGAIDLANNLRLRVLDLGLSHAGSAAGRVSVSVGVSSVRPTGGIDISLLFKTADDALYAAKSAGRNNVQARPVDLRVGRPVS